MKSSYKIATLLYVFDDRDRVLLMQRNKEPNRGLWSPSGGKLETGVGESPHECAMREAREELGITIRTTELHLTGIVSERGGIGEDHWLMFLFEINRPLSELPQAHPEGTFGFFGRTEIEALPIPLTDREMIWPLFWKHRGGFFAAHCRRIEGETDQWVIEESVIR